MCFCIIDAPCESDIMHGSTDVRMCSLGEAALLRIFAKEIQEWQAAGIKKQQAARIKHIKKRPTYKAAMELVEWRKEVRKMIECAEDVLSGKRAAEKTVPTSDDLPPCPLCGEIPANLKACMEHDCDLERLFRTTALT